MNNLGAMRLGYKWLVRACWAVVVASLLAGCAGVGGPTIRQAGPTPPDPPPLPASKPVFRAAPTSAAEPTRQPVVAAVAIAKSPAAKTPATIVGYTVRPGDTVFGIGRRLSVPLRSIIDANGLRPPYTLRKGQVLRIPNPRKHVVAKGDTVYGIARRYRVNLTELVRLNHIPMPFTIAPGQDLILPVPMRPLAQTRIATATQPAKPRPTNPPVAAVGSKSLNPKTQTAALRPLPIPAPVPASPPPASKVRLPPAAIPVPPPRGGSSFLWPVRGRVVTKYGPASGGLYNDGINILAPRGTPVRAADNGVVAYVGNELRGFGNLILVKHAGGWVTAYAHNETLLVRRGDKVARGQTIAQVGNTGNVAKPQLHFEIRRGTRAVNPIGLLARQKAAVVK